MANNNNINDLMHTLSARLGTDPSKLQEAAKKGEMQDLLKKMNPKQAEQLQKVLSDEQSAKKLLDTPQAKMILKKLMGDK